MISGPESRTSQPAIRVDGVWKIFGSRYAEAYKEIQEKQLTKKEVLERFNCVVGVSDISFEVNQGEIFCVMGLSGSGKSTLIRHINRLLDPTVGHIYINGVDVMGLTQKELQDFRNRHMAMVFQNFGLMPHRSVLDNIALPLEIRKVNKNDRLRIAEENLHLVELGSWGNKFAHELSGGMQQRIGLARALASDPDILLMDEPFSALDPLIRRQLQDQFMSLAAKMKKTTIFITHDLEEAVRIGDRIAIMRDGMLIQEDTPENIILNPIDDYVAEFVAGISPLKIVKAHTVMIPIQKYEAENGPVADDLPIMNEGDSLIDLVAKSVEHEKPLMIKEKNGSRLGVVTTKSLLKSIVEGKNPNEI